MHRGPLQPGLQPFDDYLDISTFFNQTRVKVEDDVHIYVELQMIMNIGHDLDISLFIFTQTVIYPVQYAFGLEEDRFKTDHAMLYICGIALFVTCFLFERLFGLVTMTVDWFCCMDNDDVEQTVCTNIFEDLSLEDQFHEIL